MAGKNLGSEVLVLGREVTVKFAAVTSAVRERGFFDASGGVAVFVQTSISRGADGGGHTYDCRSCWTSPVPMLVGEA